MVTNVTRHLLPFLGVVSRQIDFHFQSADVLLPLKSERDYDELIMINQPSWRIGLYQQIIWRSEKLCQHRKCYIIGLDKRRFYFHRKSRWKHQQKCSRLLRMSFTIFPLFRFPAEKKQAREFRWYFIVKCPLPSAVCFDISIQTQARVEAKRGA